MAIVINGSGTVTGLAVGGLPDGTVDAGTLATNSVDSAELIDGAVDNSHMAAMAASKLTGALPAISGGSLTGLVKGQMPSGMVIQAVTVVRTTATTISTTGQWVATDLTANITPRNSNSKVLVMVTGSQYTDVNDQSAAASIFRGSTNLGHATYGFMPTYFNVGGTSGTDVQMACSATVLDSPSSGSAVTYTVYCNTDKNSYRWGGIRNGHSTITLLEIAG